MVRILFVLQILTVLCQINVTFAQEGEEKIWTFLEELRIFSKLKNYHQGDGVINHEESYESLINEIFLKQNGKFNAKGNKLKKKIKDVESTSEVKSQEDAIMNDGESRLIMKLNSQLWEEDGTRRSVTDWIQLYAVSFKDSNAKRYEKMENFIASEFHKTKFSEGVSGSDESKMDKICRMISSFIEIPFTFGMYILHNHTDRYIPQRLIYRCAYQLNQFRETPFQIWLLPLNSAPFGYMIVILDLISDRSYIVDYIQIPEPNQILLGHRLIDSSYSMEPSLLNFRSFHATRNAFGNLVPLAYENLVPAPHSSPHHTSTHLKTL